jgi:hypothetical protein
VNAFHVIGGCLALWAVVLTVLGIVSEGFPAKAVTEKVVIAVSVILAVAALSAAILTASTKGDKKHGGDTTAALTR